MSRGLNAGKRASLEATATEWERAVAFYTDFCLDHAAEVGQEPNARKLLSWVESQTVATPAHPSPVRAFAAVCPQMPTVLRRAAIQAASGAVRGYLGNLRRWEGSGPKRRGRMPKPPRPHPHLVAYAGMVTLRMADFRDGFVRLHLVEGGRWRWLNVPVDAPPYATELFTQSEREKERITILRAQQRARMAAEGRSERSSEERWALLAAPGVWVAQSPTLIRRGDGWALHVPFEQRVPIGGKAEDRRRAEPDLKVATVDQNADSTVAAVWEGQRCRGVKTLWQARENAKRERVLRKVARKQKRSGQPVKGERSNAGLWRYICGLDTALAWQIAAAILTWAVAAGVQVLVFEYLRPYRPERGLSWSRRVNRKRSYWLRGKVLAHVRHLALCQGILTVERNPAWTSRACPRCGHLGERFSPGERGYPSRFRCGHCGWTGDANVVAALNLKRKWDRTFRYPTAEEKRAAEPSRRRKAGAAASREGSPGTVGANASTADAPAA